MIRRNLANLPIVDKFLRAAGRLLERLGLRRPPSPPPLETLAFELESSVEYLESPKMGGGRSYYNDPPTVSGTITVPAEAPIGAGHYLERLTLESRPGPAVRVFELEGLHITARHELPEPNDYDRPAAVLRFHSPVRVRQTLKERNRP